MKIIKNLKAWWKDPKNSYVRWQRLILIILAILGIGSKIIFGI